MAARNYFLTRVKIHLAQIKYLLLFNLSTYRNIFQTIKLSGPSALTRRGWRIVCHSSRQFQRFRALHRACRIPLVRNCLHPGALARLSWKRRLPLRRPGISAFTGQNRQISGSFLFPRQCLEPSPRGGDGFYPMGSASERLICASAKFVSMDATPSSRVNLSFRKRSWASVCRHDARQMLCER